MANRLARLMGTVVLGVWAVPATAQALPETPSTPYDRTIAVRVALKGSGLFSHYPNNLDAFPTRRDATGFGRARIDTKVRLGRQTFGEAAYEHRLLASSSFSGLSLVRILPGDVAVPFRVRQLDWQVSSTSQVVWRHELDRAAIHSQIGSGALTVGRQAIGWGRGVLFSAIDLFAPFTPLEVDREWRRGVDAVRADIKVTDHASADVVAAAGERLDESAFAARFRGYTGDADLELVVGRRAGDLLSGVASSIAFGGAELHGEASIVRLGNIAPSRLFQMDQQVVKAVAGLSRRLPIFNGVLFEAEYHYSGFGVTAARELPVALADLEFRRRYLRGDFQVLTRHAIAALATSESSPSVAWTAQWLTNPIDHSGIVVPSVTFTRGDRWSTVFSVYLPYGKAPEGLRLSSEYGSSPTSVFVELRFYR